MDRTSYPTTMPEYQPLFRQVQTFISEQLNSDPQLSSIGIEFLPESNLDIEYGIRRNLGKQGTVGIVNTLRGTYGGHDQDSCAWEMEAEIDILENPTVRRAWLKKQGIQSGTTVDIVNYVQESMCGPASPTYGKFCPVSQEIGEDNGIIVGKSIMRTFAIADVSAVVSGDSDWHIRYATEADISALWNAVGEISSEISGMTGDYVPLILDGDTNIDTNGHSFTIGANPESPGVPFEVNPYGQVTAYNLYGHLFGANQIQVNNNADEVGLSAFNAIYHQGGGQNWRLGDVIQDYVDVIADDLHQDMSAIQDSLSSYIPYPVLQQEYSKWEFKMAPQEVSSLSRQVVMGSYEESIPGEFNTYIQIGDNARITVNRDSPTTYNDNLSAQANIPRLKIGTNWIPLFRDLPKYTSQLTNDSKFIKYISYASHPDRWIINFGASSTGGIEIVSDSCHPTQSYINIAGTKLTPPGYDPELSTRTSTRGLMKREVSLRETTDDHLRYGDKPIAYVDEVSAVEQGLSAYATNEHLDSSISNLHDELTAIVESAESELQDAIDELSANMSKSIVRRWEEARGLKFTGGSGGGTVSMTASGSAPTVSLEYNDGTGWKDFTVGETSVVLEENQSMVMRAKTANSRFGSSSSNYNHFTIAGEVSASDSIMYLLDRDGSLSATMGGYCFCNLFRDCTSLTTAPELPSTSLSGNCYYGMFNGCTSLTEAPELQATTLASQCYMTMFKGCTSLTTPPELPATTLGDGCYWSMFQGCTSLTTPPELPATTLASGCYERMFQGCTSLTSAPELPATTLKQNCYENMFNGCSSIVEAPELPATTLASGCYYNMFNGCTSLSSITLGYTGDFSSTYFNKWVLNVSPTGTFTWDGTDTTRGSSAIPTNWTVQTITPDFPPYLKFTSLQNGSTWYLNNSNLEYSTDNGSTWTDYVEGETITMNEGDEMFIRASTPQSSLNNATFVMTGSIAADGPIESLLNQNYEEVSALEEQAIYGLFQNCTALRTAPKLMATIANDGAFTYLFNGCSNLSGEVVFPNLSADVNNSMAVAFNNSGISKFSAPNLKSIWNMYCSFSNCQNLEEVELPQLRDANTQGDYGLYATFENCPNLRRVDFGEISAFNASSSTVWAFENCTSLEVIDCSKVSTPLPCNDFSNMFSKTNNTFKVVVPDSLYSTWLATGDWASGQSHIVRASDYNA